MKVNLEEIKGIELTLKEIIDKIFFPLKNAVIDFEYLHKINSGENSYYLSKYYYSFSRLQFYTGVFIIIYINKLLNKNEDCSLTCLLEAMKEKHKDSKWKDRILIKDINGYFKKLRSNDTKILFKKVLTTRHKFYAHLDKDNVKIDFDKIKIGLKEMKVFVDIAESIIRDLNLKISDSDVTFDISKGELGNAYIEELNELTKLKYK